MKNVFKTLAIVALAAAIGFSMTVTLASCEDGVGGPGPGYNPGGSNPGTTPGGGTGGGTSTGNWPSESVLSRWGFSGFSVPTGASGFYWAEYGTGLVITFDGTSSTEAAVQRWFTNNGWDLEDASSTSSGMTYAYRKEPYFATYSVSARSHTVVAIRTDD